MNGQQQQQHALVTGGTRGIGRALVEGLLQRGARVTATGRNAASLEAARTALPQVQWIASDLADAGARAALAAQLTPAGLSLVIHNGGVQQLRRFDEAGDDEAISVQQEVDVNLVAPIDLSRRLLPALAAQPQAALVFISSGLALAPKQSSPVYCASKAGLRSFAKALRAQQRLAARPVRVIEALPPLVDTDMTRGRGRGKLSAEAAARQILDGIAAGRSEIDVGATRWLRALMRLSPAWGERLMIGR